MRESAFRVAEKPDLVFPFQISGISGMATALGFGRRLPSHGSRSVLGGEMRGGDTGKQGDRVWSLDSRRPHEPRPPPTGWLNGRQRRFVATGLNPSDKKILSSREGKGFASLKAWICYTPTRAVSQDPTFITDRYVRLLWLRVATLNTKTMTLARECTFGEETTGSCT